MAITDKNTLKSWFLRGLKPLESHFADWMDSYWHKSESIPTNSIDGLEETLNNKAESTALNEISADLTRHKEDDTRHKIPAEQGKLDHLADRPDTTYATKNELSELKDNPDVIIIPVDFTKPFEELEKSITDFIAPLIEDGSMFTKPVFLQYIWKDDYVTEDAPVFKSIVHRSAVERRVIRSTEVVTLKFNSPVVVTMIETYDSCALCLSIRIGNEFSLTWNEYEDEIPVEVVFATEDGNGLLNLLDKGWMTLRKELDKGRSPMLFLKTETSVMYCPASYDLTPVDPAVPTSRYQGNIQISYVRETDGVSELWVETYTFDDFGGMGESYQLSLKKHKISDNEDIVVVPIDFTKTKAEREAEIKAFIQPLVADGTFLMKPLFAKYIWRDFYDGSADDRLYSDIIFNEPMPNTTGYYFRSPKEVASVDAPDDYGKICTAISVNYTNDPVTIAVRFSKVEQKYDRTFFLYDNGDGIISAGDGDKNFSNVTSKNWSLFFTSLQEGLTPTVYLKTPNTDIYTVASYKIAEDSITRKYSGYIEIQYVKVVDGVHQLWIERRIFTQELGGFFGIGSQYETNAANGYDPVIARINLDGETFDDFVRISRIQVLPEYPTDLSTLKEGDIVIKLAE